MPVGVTAEGGEEHSHTTRTRIEDVLKSYAGGQISSEKKRRKKKVAESDAFVLESLRRSLDLQKSSENEETILHNTYNQEQQSPRFNKNKQRERVPTAKKSSNVMAEDIEATDAKIKKKKKKKRQLPLLPPDEDDPGGYTTSEVFTISDKIKEDKQQLILEPSTPSDDQPKKPRKKRETMTQGEEVVTKIKIRKEPTLNNETIEADRTMTLADLDNSPLPAVRRAKVKSRTPSRGREVRTAEGSPEPPVPRPRRSREGREKSRAAMSPDRPDEEVALTEEGEETARRPKAARRTKKKNAKAVAGGKEASSMEVAQEAERREEDEQALGVFVHRTDRLASDPLLACALVRVYLVDAATGQHVRKEDCEQLAAAPSQPGSSDTEHPLTTQPCDVRTHRSLLPEWEEQLVFPHRLGPFLRVEPGAARVLLFFEVVDLVSMDETQTNYSALQTDSGGRRCLAWAFLKLVGANGAVNVGGKMRLQLFYPPARFRHAAGVLPVYEWYAKHARLRYPATIYVTVKGLRLPSQLDPSGRSVMALQQEQGSRAPDEPGSGAASSPVRASQRRDALKWSRLPGQTCYIPNKLALTLKAGTAGCFRVRFSPDGRALAAACVHRDSHPVFVFEVPSGQLLMELPGHLGLVYDLSWSHDSSHLLSSSSDGTARLWNVEGRVRAAEKVLPHPCFTYAGQLHPGATAAVAVTGAYDGMLRVWDVGGATGTRDGRLLRELDGHRGYVNAVCFDADGLQMFSGDSTGVVLVWRTFVSQTANSDPLRDWAVTKEIKEPDLKGVPINHLWAHPNGRRLLVHARDSALRLIDVRVQVTRKFTGASNQRERVHSCVSPCGTFLLSGSEDGVAYVWNIDTGDQVAMYSELGYQAPVRDVHFHPHEHMVAFCCHGDAQPVLVFAYDHKVAQTEARSYRDVQEPSSAAPGHLAAGNSRGPRWLGSTGPTGPASWTAVETLGHGTGDAAAAAASLFPSRLQSVRRKLDSVLADSLKPGATTADYDTERTVGSSLAWNSPVPFSGGDHIAQGGGQGPRGHAASLAPSLLSPHSWTPASASLASRMMPNPAHQPGGLFSPVGRVGRPPSLRLHMNESGSGAAGLRLEAEGDPAVQETVVALYDYTARRSDELSLRRGERVLVLFKDNESWWFGQADGPAGAQGYFPASYVADQKTYEDEEKLDTWQGNSDASRDLSSRSLHKANLTGDAAGRSEAETEAGTADKPKAKLRRKKTVDKSGSHCPAVPPKDPEVITGAGHSLVAEDTNLEAAVKKPRRKKVAKESMDTGGKTNSAFDPE
ncbi:jouberin isoform X2 [Lethenteron reissneri]|uniref:jouberin isoform X2 n=1 Tax=Lethenteron reissneri TaxID=7753 RepID=UPI002AB77B1F|nr:jouberin isoform X2 [Lethenteron reissneri]